MLWMLNLKFLCVPLVGTHRKYKVMESPQWEKEGFASLQIFSASPPTCVSLPTGVCISQIGVVCTGSHLSLPEMLKVC